MKYYVVSDIHGHFDELIYALEKSTFDMRNAMHKLIVAGDMFDRGSQSKEVLTLLYKLHQEEKAIIIKGNHEIFLEEFLEGNEKRVNFNIKHNGFSTTLKSLIPNYFDLTFEKKQNYVLINYPYLKDWLNNLPYYFETDNFIVTHAGLDFSNGDFKNGNFHKAVWIDPIEFFEQDLNKTYGLKKVVVVGHRFTIMIRKAFAAKEISNDIYFHHDYQKIAIDGGVYSSNQINVLDLQEALDKINKFRREK